MLLTLADHLVKLPPEIAKLTKNPLYVHLMSELGAVVCVAKKLSQISDDYAISSFNIRQ